MVSPDTTGDQNTPGSSPCAGIVSARIWSIVMGQNTCGLESRPKNLTSAPAGNLVKATARRRAAAPGDVTLTAVTRPPSTELQMSAAGSRNFAPLAGISRVKPTCRGPGPGRGPRAPVTGGKITLVGMVPFE